MRPSKYLNTTEEKDWIQTQDISGTSQPLAHHQLKNEINLKKSLKCANASQGSTDLMVRTQLSLSDGWQPLLLAGLSNNIGGWREIQNVDYEYTAIRIFCEIKAAHNDFE